MSAYTTKMAGVSMAPKSKITINFNNVKWCTDLKAQPSFFSKSGDRIHQQAFCLYCPAKVTRLWLMSKSWQVFHSFNGGVGGWGGGVNVLPYFSETRPCCWGQCEHEEEGVGSQRRHCPLPSTPLPFEDSFHRYILPSYLLRLPNTYGTDIITSKTKDYFSLK